MKDERVEGVTNTEVLVVGAGAGGAAVAGELLRAGREVLVVEAGGMPSGPRGASPRNADLSPAGERRYAEFVKGSMAPLNGAPAPPPRIPGLTAIQGIGGMLLGWTNNCPRYDASELPAWLESERWDALLRRAEGLLGVDTELSRSDPRFPALLAGVEGVVGELPEGRAPQAMPVSARGSAQSWRYGCADDLLAGVGDAALKVLTEHVARRLLTDGSRVSGVEVFPGGGGEALRIDADVVVLAGGPIGTPQLLSASGLDCGPALGAYLMEHTNVVTRFVLDEELRREPGAEFAFPPGVLIPSSPAHPWSTQVQDFPLGASPLVSEEIDPGATTDIISFCPIAPRLENRLTFDPGPEDAFGLPAPGGRLELTEQDLEDVVSAIGEHYRLLDAVGDPSLGLAPLIPPRGASTHVMGTCRMGVADDGTSVVSPEGRLWRYENCFVAGNAVQSCRAATNPTLTSVAFALHSADSIGGVAAGSLVARVGEEASG